MATTKKVAAQEYFLFSHFQSRQKIYIVGETKPFRKLARELPLGEDSTVIEIGSSYGECLNILAKRSGGRAIGFEISQECVDSSVKKYPRLFNKETNESCVHLCNVLSSEGAMLVNEFASKANTAFIDIGGDRHAEAVIHLCENSLHHPEQIVIKCRLLFRAAKDYLKSNSIPCVDVNVKAGTLQEKDATAAAATTTTTATTNEFKNNPDLCTAEADKEVDHRLTQWWQDLVDKVNLNGLNSGAAGVGAPRWHQNQPKQRMLAETKRKQESEIQAATSLLPPKLLKKCE